jgi:hypothetical protein
MPPLYMAKSHYPIGALMLITVFDAELSYRLHCSGGQSHQYKNVGYPRF